MKLIKIIRHSEEILNIWDDTRMRIFKIWPANNVIFYGCFFLTYDLHKITVSIIEILNTQT